MPRVDYTGVPEVTAQSNPGDNYQHIQANPAAFGGNIAEGAAALGQGVSHLGEFWGKVQTDTMVNDTNAAATKMVDQFKTLRGADALNAQAEYETNLKELFSNARGNLSSTRQQVDFDNSTRSFYDRFLQPQVFNHANQQANETATEVNNNGVKLHYDVLASLNVDDPDYGDKADDAIFRAVQYAEKNAHLKLGASASAEDVAAYVQPVIQGALKTQAQAMAVTHPDRAVEFLDHHREQIGIDYPALSSQFRERALQAKSLKAVDDSFAEVAHNLPNVPIDEKSNVAVKQAIFIQESNSGRAPGTSGNPTQVQEGTFAQYKQGDESFSNPADVAKVSDRYFNAVEKAAGGDPQRIAVGWFSGIGNIAPANSPTPWIRDTSDKNNKSVSSYVQDINSMLGKNGPALAARASVYDSILTKTQGDPAFRQAALKEVAQRYNAAEIADLQDKKARQAATDASIRRYGDAIRQGKPDRDYLNDPNLTEAQIRDLEKYHKETITGELNGTSGDPGPGYSDVHERILHTDRPDRIVNDEQLLKLLGDGTLKPYGFNQARDFLKEVNAPGAEADKLLQSNFYASMKKEVTLEDPTDHQMMDGGQANWDKALPILNQAIKEGREKGLTNAQLMNPDSKDYVGNAIPKNLLPTDAKKLHADINRDAAAAKTKDGAAFDLSTIKTLEDATKAYNDHKITKAQARVLWDKNGWDKAVPTSPHVPTNGTP